MKLIDEKEVEQEKLKYSKQEWQDCFNFGVSFAEQKLTPLFLEFADYCDTFELYGTNYTPVKKTTDQLFEQFLKTKQK